MSSNQSDQLVNNRLLVGGAVLTGVGSMIATVGMALGAAAVVGAGRRWQQRTEMTPAQLAKHAYGAARTASAAGVGAWRDPGRVPAPRPPATVRQTTTDGAGLPVS